MNLKEYKSYLEDTPSYNTLQEKNACIYLMENNDSIKVAKLLGLKPTNPLEAVAMIFQSRKKSVSEIIEVKSTCVHCNSEDFYFIDIDSLFFNKGIDESIPIKLIEEMDEIETYLSKDINNMDISEFNKIESIIINNNRNIFNNITNIKCKKCQKDFDIRINYTDIISKFPIKNIYEQYLDLVQFTNMIKNDVDNMPPFEREIFIGLIQERENKKE